MKCVGWPVVVTTRQKHYHDSSHKHVVGMLMLIDSHSFNMHPITSDETPGSKHGFSPTPPIRWNRGRGKANEVRPYSGKIIISTLYK